MDLTFRNTVELDPQSNKFWMIEYEVDVDCHKLLHFKMPYLVLAIINAFRLPEKV